MIKVKEMGVVGRSLIPVERLCQWDTNREVIITPPEGYQVTSVEFFNGTTDKAPSVEIEESEGILVAKIPNSFLQSANRITVFLIFEDENGRKTIASKGLSVVARPQPAGYVAEPDEVRSWQKLYEMLAKILENPVDEQAVAAAVQVYMELNPVEVPENLSNLNDDAEHRTVTDVEKEAWNKKLDASKLPEVVNEALAQAKESGEFDGTSVTVENVSESTESGGSNVVTFSDGNEVTVKNGKDGYTPVKGVDYFGEDDKAEMVDSVLEALPTWQGGAF